MVDDQREAVSLPANLPFFKMSGSGNDFVVVDGRLPGAESVIEPWTVRRICAPRTGVGADGVVLLTVEGGAAFRMIYVNADGSRASMCGNAALCSTRLAVELGMAGARGMEFETDSGRIAARLADGIPEIDLAPISEVRVSIDLGLDRGERRMGFVRAGVPHVVVRCDEVEQVAVESRGGALRRHQALADGANVNFVSPDTTIVHGNPGAAIGVARGADEFAETSLRDGAWAMRTFERGVEAETLACGTGAVSSALMLRLWGESGDETWIRTRSGRLVRVRLRQADGVWRPSLAGEGRIVFQGTLRELL